ncbi:hypothetical protein PILCRDRAFT_214633 [Piloderma croceum F 1598]|uniref:Uncharacterized protein n=1 Tax=Piloderma croceum (strain F 1598) TaxID=765440 RepID=A0A0C3FYA4_PILCF|nr:hypothetical protein PILCRDRAFT_214633 [Piloderma croceum F 1598]
MPSSLELGMEDFDSVYHNIQDSFDSFHEFGTGYIADMSKNQFDTDCHDLSPYLTVPAFDTSLSNISSGPSSYPSSHINTPVNVDPESSAADEDSDMDSDYDVEHLSLSDEKKHIVIGHATYATSNAYVSWLPV